MKNLIFQNPNIRKCGGIFDENTIQESISKLQIKATQPNFWDNNISQAEVESAARLAQLHDFVMGLPERYDTFVGDRGLKLSGGECQRVAVARAIMRRSDVLIFDEATSALDNVTEELVYNAIGTLREKTLIIVIAHRLSTVRNADQIVVLSSGKVSEVGTHDSLVGIGGAYAELYGNEC